MSYYENKIIHLENFLNEIDKFNIVIEDNEITSQLGELTSFIKNKLLETIELNRIQYLNNLISEIKTNLNDCNEHNEEAKKNMLGTINGLEKLINKIQD